MSKANGFILLVALIPPATFVLILLSVIPSAPIPLGDAGDLAAPSFLASLTVTPVLLILYFIEIDRPASSRGMKELAVVDLLVYGAVYALFIFRPFSVSTVALAAVIALPPALVAGSGYYLGRRDPKTQTGSV